MKRYISKGIKNSLHIAIFVFTLVCFYANARCQDDNKTSIMSMTPEYSEKEMDSLKWDIVTRGDYNSFWECELALFSKGSMERMYTEFLPYTLIMAFVYESLDACYFVYTLIKEYREERGEVLTVEELRLCIRSLTTYTLKLKDCDECKEMIEECKETIDECEKIKEQLTKELESRGKVQKN